MHLMRYLRPELVCMELSLPPEPPPEVDARSEHWRWRLKEHVIDDMVELFSLSGEVRNASKFRRDYIERERKGSTAIGSGIAVPHVRSMQPKRIVICVARSADGVEYLAPDGEPVKLLFGITGPTYEEKIYLRAYTWIARVAQEDWVVDSVMSAETPDEVIGALRSFH